MAHKFSFIVLGGSGTTIKQIHCSRRKLYGLAALAGLIFLVGCYGLFDYLAVHGRLATKNNVEKALAQQTEEVLHQREQIQKFAVEINDLKEKLIQLNKFEEQIRVIANIDQPDGRDSLFGVGGSTPEDLNPNIELTVRHQRLIKDMHRHINQLDTASSHQIANFETLLDRLEAQKNMLAHTPAIRPAAGWISSRFGYRQSPFTGRREFHKGMDIANRVGTPIVASADGIVSYCGKKGLIGNLVVVDHGHGLVSRYGHIDSMEINVGSAVKRGQIIARMGNTGRSTGPHLHYEVRLNGVPVNPSKYILN
jgi:murein DD-endopeptidase MepM/ murein hydrolase activator NlpD